MSKTITFICGIVAGIVLTFVGLYIYGRVEGTINNQDMEGVTMFEAPGDVMHTDGFKVFQVVATNGALCKTKEDGYYLGPVCMLINMDGKYYYDEEIITVPKGKVARQVGIYQYTTRKDFGKTVPIVQIMDK